ncbi:Regulatory protein alcR [Exophiala dermatitidis]|uniref:Zn(2)-C6 fungal-type domain-containing protein n=1 Tax=Exophiala dermatitidis (strain ATCC 34100 / CBS 525.76 / NIH/UT8656) TaxID=858893 RepID=H6C1L0_EXODN|nr:uncharacterized protein HMPREF1120_06608 [Exophiala dermatitidis NIH/UT8656]EHY58600.1 hypothetical protein HMPREF1120_06608 [Exophiala dermatitidis NIH/UT8656]
MEEQQHVVIERVRRRRQHSSCDQCRKAKRACDAAFKSEHQHQHHQRSINHSNGKTTPQRRLAHHHQDKLQVPVTRCTNCQRAGRTCTFDWLESTLPKLIKGTNKNRTQQPRVDIDSASEQQRGTTQQRSTFVSTQGNNPAVISQLGTTQHVDFDLFDDVELFDIWGTPETLVDHGISTKQANDGPMAPYPIERPMLPWLSFPADNNNKPPLVNQARSCTIQHDAVLQSIEEEFPGPEDHDFEEQNDDEKAGIQSFDAVDALFRGGQHDEPTFLGSDCSSVPLFSDDEISGSLLSSSTLSSGTNRWLLTENWLRVYHDSLENALSCWLTERNCPYTLARGGGSVVGDSNSLSNTWGSQWSNRIYTRVCNLDRFINDLPGRRLSRSESATAGKALNAAVMAFGVQWAQAGDRGGIRDRISPDFTSSSLHDDMQLPTADEFGRSVQETLWNQARQALHEAASVQSYRVTFANIIFSLTQRPLNVQDWEQSSNWEPRCGSQEDTDNLQSRWECLQEIINADGPPVFLEAASRQLLSSRWQWERYNRQKAKKAVSSPHDAGWERVRASATSVTLSREHRDTFQLLTWLVIMFDTISAAMLQRPPVVADEDTTIDSADPWKIAPSSPGDSTDNEQSALSACEIDLDGWDPEPGQSKLGEQRRSSNVWDDFLLQDRGLKDYREVRWSLDVDDAASILCDAAPVKVLLFRKVGHIQKLISRRAGSDALERAVAQALKVYAEWNRSYGKFIAQCMARHHLLPARIQSWYLILAGHWHLGAILLADVVDEMDESGLGGRTQREARRVSGFSDDIRRKNATAISDLCRCSLHGQALSFPTAREFTYPVNQVALLSEPWTLVLIQSFSRAGFVFVSQLNAPRRPRNGGWSTVEDEIGLAKRRCGHCIEGLLNLANKSDMAYLAAKFLRDCLRDLDNI